MASLNRASFIGNVTATPELRRTANGVAVVDFTLAINEKFTDKNGNKRESTEFLSFSAWNKQAEVLAQYASKGQSLYVEAKAKVDKWDDKTTGEKRSKIKFEVVGYQFLGGNGGGGSGKPSQAVVSKTDDEVEENLDDDDSIPF